MLKKNYGITTKISGTIPISDFFIALLLVLEEKMLVAAWSGLDQQISTSLDTIYPTDNKISVENSTDNKIFTISSIIGIFIISAFCARHTITWHRIWQFCIFLSTL